MTWARDSIANREVWHSAGVVPDDDELLSDEVSHATRVAIAMPQGMISGAEKVLLELCHEVVPTNVVICAPIESELAEACRDLGYEVREFSVPKLREAGWRVYIPAVWKAGKALRNCVIEDEIDVLHSFLSMTTKVATPVAAITRTPLVQSVHDVTSPQAVGWLHSKAQQWFVRLLEPERTIAVSSFLREVMIDQGYRSDRIVVVHNGVAVPARSPTGLNREGLGIPEDAVVFLQIGRITEWKGHAVALAAFEKLRQTRPAVDTRLVIVGRPFSREDEAYETTLDALIARSPVAEFIAKVPHTQSPGNAYDLADIVLVPSVEADPFPTVVLEAGLCRRAAIVTDRGGAKEAVVHGKTGLVCAPTPDALAAAMIEGLPGPWRRSAGACACDHITRQFPRGQYGLAVTRAWVYASSTVKEQRRRARRSQRLG